MSTDSIGEWLFKVRQEYADLHEDKIQLEQNTSLKPLLREALLTRKERLIEACEKKFALGKAMSEIAGILEEATVTITSSELTIAFSWSKNDSH